jgi:transglutaminase-like putative cysteine protease
VAVLELTGAMLAQANPSLTPNDADLLPTEDVQITEEIKALAEQLEHHPVKIFNWVRNNIEYLPTYGSIQGSQMTLDNQRGNAFDTASLLIALLRASNIPARYAYGTVQIPIEKVMNWVGGVESEIAALELMLQG